MKTLQELFQVTSNSNSLSGDIWGGRQLINELQTKAKSVLDALIPIGASVVLSYPNTTNVGDSLIWLGEIAYLKSRNISLAYVCDCNNYSARRLAEVLTKDSIILLHGGGNFGTLWPEEQELRLRVLRDFPGQKIIQFSQSICYENSQAIEDTALVIRNHGNYTLLARDTPSFDFAKLHFDCEAILCPDMAFFIGPIKASSAPSFDRFILSRTDIEKDGDWLADLPNIQQDISVSACDWLYSSWMERIISRIEIHTVKLRQLIDPHNKLLFILWHYLAELRLKRGKSLLEQGSVIISDRLHTHILALLLDKPHVMIDNSNKKISSLHQDWTKSYQGVLFAKNLKEALIASSTYDTDCARQDK